MPSENLQRWIEGYHDGVKELDRYIRLLLKTAKREPDLFSEEIAGIEFVAKQSKKYKEVMFLNDWKKNESANAIQPAD